MRNRSGSSDSGRNSSRLRRGNPALRRGVNSTIRLVR